jgi:hypothetical protein
LKAGQSDYDREERQEIKGDKSKARDTAFKLLYLILLEDFMDEIKDGAKVFNAVLYLVSHAATFKWRTRSVVRAAYEERFVVRAAYEERFVVSAKQTAALDKWEKKDPAKLAVEDAADVTTEEEKESDYYYYDSDYSD